MSIESVRRTLVFEGEAILGLAHALDSDAFSKALDWIHGCSGRLITCGVGKSGHIARKTAGTFSSTGTPSLFLHAAEAVHGDLGMVTDRDVVLLYSHSGETDEIVSLFPSLKAIGARTVLITGRRESSAGRLADLVLDTLVEHEACPNNLAPTTSTTVMLAVSDALAVAVMERRGFGKEDFAKFHPSGTLGKRLLLTVGDVMRPRSEIAVVSGSDTVFEVVRAMTQAGVGVACVERENRLVGLISESDLRRHELATGFKSDAPASELTNTGMTTIRKDLMAVEALEVFQNHPRKIGELPVVDDQGATLGLLVLKDLLRSGIL